MYARFWAARSPQSLYTLLLLIICEVATVDLPTGAMETYAARKVCAWIPMSLRTAMSASAWRPVAAPLVAD